MRQRIEIRLPVDLKERAKRKASPERRSLNSLIEEGLRRILAINRKRMNRLR
jgi:hypothetical protein